MMTLGSGCAATAIGVNMDMTEGVVARFRIMSISRASVLTGRAVGSIIRTLISVVLVIGVALLIGFRPTAGPAPVACGFRLHRAAQPGPDLACARNGNGGQVSCGSQQLHAPAPVRAVHQQRLRPPGHDAGGRALVRREPTLHLDDRDLAWIAAGHADRQQRRSSPSPGASRSRWSATSGRARHTTATRSARLDALAMTAD